MKTVLFVPGFKQDMHNRDYAATLQVFASKGYAPVFVAINWSGTTIEDWKKELEAVYARHDPANTILAGFSFGAMTALVVAAKRNPYALWLFSLSPYFAEDLERYSDEELYKDIGIRRSKSFRKLDFACIARQIYCETLLFVGEQEAKKWPTLKERIIVPLSF
jgi:predicted alpha/beta hydrolase family esterase